MAKMKSKKATQISVATRKHSRVLQKIKRQTGQKQNSTKTMENHQKQISTKLANVNKIKK